MTDKSTYELISVVAQAIEDARPCPATDGCGAYRSRKLHCPDCPHSDAWEVLDEHYGVHPTADWLRKQIGCVKLAGTVYAQSFHPTRND